MRKLLSRKYLISFFYIIVCIVGVSTWKTINVENSPELNLPSITVSYYWASTVPEIMEQEITRKVEGAAKRLRDVTEIRSITSEGRSSVTISFNKKTPVDFRSIELTEYLNNLDDTFPSNVSPASISRNVPEQLDNQQTFIVYTLSGEFEDKELLEYANRSLKTKLIGLEGLAEVRLEGINDPALIVEFNRKELEKYSLTTEALMLQIRDRLSWRNPGFTDVDETRISIVVPPSFISLADIMDMRISIPASINQLKLSDIAKVYLSDYPSKTRRRINGSPALTLEFIKEGGADAMSLAESIIKKMDEIKEQLPVGMELLLQVDSTEQLRNQFNELEKQGLISALLVIIVIFVFIRKLRAPFVIIGSVIFSIFLSLTTLYLIGYTLNVITIAGITIALGMLIDNAVVVFEQINPGLPQMRSERVEYVSKSLPKSVVPVLGSTFTTIGIFIPLLFALEDLKLFLLPLAVALSITLVSSVVIAFTWIPYSLIWLTPVHSSGKFWSFKKKARSFSGFALRFLWLKHKLRWVFLAIVIPIIGVPIFLIEEPNWNDQTVWPAFTKNYFENRELIDPWVGGLTYRFMTETYFGSPWSGFEQENIIVDILTPQGTPILEIDKIVRNYEEAVKPYEEAFLYYEARMSEYYGANLKFAIKPEYLTKPAPYYFLNDAMYLAARTGNVSTTVSGLDNGISVGYDIESFYFLISLTGYDYNTILELARRIENRLRENPRVEEIDINFRNSLTRSDFKQFVLRFDEKKVLSMGLNKNSLLNDLQADFNPENPFGRIEFEGDEIYLIGRSTDQLLYEEDLLESQRVTNNISYSLNSFATIVKEDALSEIYRKNQSYERLVSFKFFGNYRLGRELIDNVLSEMPTEIGTNIEIGNSLFNTETTESRDNILFVLLLAIVSVWMIVSALLESWSGPLFVLMTIPFCGLGIMAGTLFNDLFFDRGAIAGALLSIGIVVNNAILIFHQKQLENKEGKFGIRCWYYVFKKKLRTIIITTATTIAGLIPMMLIGNNEFWESLSIIVVWGLLSSTTLITLFAGNWRIN